MDIQLSHQVLFSILGIACSASGWWLRALYEKVDQLRKDHEAFKVNVAENVVKKDDLQDMIRDLKTDNKDMRSELKRDMERILDLLSTKQDKQ